MIDAEAAGAAVRISALRRALGTPVGTGIALLILVGSALRFRQYLFCRSLWLDEAMLAVNIASRSLVELLAPLDLNQNAPLLFLWISRVLVRVFGVNEFALRAAPQVAGMLLLPLLAATAWRAFGRPAAFVCASLAALSPALIRYANEVKPYAVDALLTAVLIAAAFGNHEADDGAPYWRRLGGIAFLGVWISNPFVFTCAAVTVALFVRHRTDARALRRLLVLVLVWAASFSASYLMVARRSAANEQLRAGYDTAFLPPTAASFERLPLMVSGTFYPVFLGDGSSAPGLSPRAAAFVILGFGACLFAAARGRGTWIAILLGGPGALAFLGASLGLYPAGVPRLMLFFAPCVLLAASGALGSFWPAAATRREGILSAILWLLLLVPSWSLALANWIAPFRGDDFRGAYAEYSSLELGEPVYVSAKAIPAWVFYSTNWAPGTRRQRELFDRRLRFYLDAGSGGLSFENRESRRGPVAASEGRELTFDFRGRIEVLGIYTGRQWKWPSYVSPVDEGWDRNEAQRVMDAARAAGRPCEWIVFERLSELSFRPLSDALRFIHGGRRQHRLSYPGVTIQQICH